MYSGAVSGVNVLVAAQEANNTTIARAKSSAEPAEAKVGYH